MVRYFYASPGVPEQVKQFFSGQLKRHEDGSEWGGAFTQEFAAYWYHLFIY